MEQKFVSGDVTDYAFVVFQKMKHYIDCFPAFFELWLKDTERMCQSFVFGKTINLCGVLFCTSAFANCKV